MNEAITNEKMKKIKASISSGIKVYKKNIQNILLKI